MTTTKVDGLLGWDDPSSIAPWGDDSHAEYRTGFDVAKILRNFIDNASKTYLKLFNPGRRSNSDHNWVIYRDESIPKVTDLHQGLSGLQAASSGWNPLARPKKQCPDCGRYGSWQEFGSSHHCRYRLR